MNIFKSKKSDFYSLPRIDWNADMNGKQFDSIIILPERRKHDSGYRCMSFVGCIDGEPVAIMSGVSDVIHFDGIGGYGKDLIIRVHGAPKLRTVTAWSIDCLPCGCLHIWARGKKIEIGYMLSSFEIFAEVPLKEDT